MIRAYDKKHLHPICTCEKGNSLYPLALEEKLGKKAPSSFWYAGSFRPLETEKRLAIVGSRHTTQENLTYARGVGWVCAETGITVVSGGAIGVDTLAMRGCLDNGGQGVVIVSCELNKAVHASMYQQALNEGRLLLLSFCEPTAPFLARTALERNTYIYALATMALVVTMQYGRGGSWHGAKSYLEKHKNTPVYLYDQTDIRAYKHLLSLGANPWPPIKEE